MKTRAYFFSILMLLPSFLSLQSCSKEMSIQEDFEQQGAELMKKVDFIINSVFTIQNENSNSRNLISDSLDQVTVDYYAGLIGYEPGVVSLQDVLEVIDKYSLATDYGIEYVLDEYQLTEIAKFTLADIANGSFIENLNEIPGYENLPVSEKDLIETANIFVGESQNRDLGCGVGAFLGFVIGSFICSPVCQIVGVIVGCIGGKGQL